MKTNFRYYVEKKNSREKRGVWREANTMQDKKKSEEKIEKKMLYEKKGKIEKREV